MTSSLFAIVLCMKVFVKFLLRVSDMEHPLLHFPLYPSGFILVFTILKDTGFLDHQ